MPKFIIINITNYRYITQVNKKQINTGNTEKEFNEKETTHILKLIKGLIGEETLNNSIVIYKKNNTKDNYIRVDTNLKQAETSIETLRCFKCGGNLYETKKKPPLDRKKRRRILECYACNCQQTETETITTKKTKKIQASLNTKQTCINCSSKKIKYKTIKTTIAPIKTIIECMHCKKIYTLDEARLNNT